MEFYSVKEAAKEWDISERRVRALCESGRIEGAVRIGGWMWNIPKSAGRPLDGRTLRFINNRDLKTGSQDYSVVNKIRASNRRSVLTDFQKAGIILDALAFDGINTTKDAILNIFKYKTQNLGLITELKILNIKQSFNILSHPISSNGVYQVNKRILCSLHNDTDNLYNEKDSILRLDALIKQFNTSWQALHPVAKSAFLFSELLRICPFKNANTETAFVILNSMLIYANLPPAIFEKEDITELKASLSSSSIRGNSQKLISLILEAICKK